MGNQVYDSANDTWPRRTGNSDGTANVHDPVKLEGNAQATLAVSTVAAQTAAVLAAGVYDVWCDVDVYVKVAATASDVTTSTGYVIFAGSVVPLLFGGAAKLGAITASGSGTLRYHKVI